MIRYTISSAKLSAKQLAEAARQHWHVENKLNWSLGVALREDACNIHRVQAAENLARVRRIALNYLKGRRVSEAESGGNRRKKRWMSSTWRTFSLCEFLHAFSLDILTVRVLHAFSLVRG